MARSGSLLILMLLLSGCSMAPPAREVMRDGYTVANWPAVPEGVTFGPVSAVDVDAQGRVYVLHGAGRKWEEPFPADPIDQPTVFVFDGKSGALLARWGAGQFIMPHGLSVDPTGKVWITDVGREQVFRFSADGRLELTLGEQDVAGDDARHFGRPTDVAFSDNEVYVSDGYLNHRVVVFDRSGRFLRQWGEKGDGERGLAVPHSVTIAGGRAYIADREHARIQVRERDGAVVANWQSSAKGHPYSVKMLPDGRFVSVEGRDAHDRGMSALRVWRRDGTVERSLDFTPLDNGPSRSHDVAVDRDGKIYLADIDGNRVVKIDLASQQDVR